jgi:hypothetical protein
MANLAEETKLLANMAAAMPQLEELLAEVNDHWVYEDKTYRFYDESMKVFQLQETTEKIVAALRGLAPHLELSKWFTAIVREGTGREFTLQSNDHWMEEARPIVDAFLHARFFLEMVCKYRKTVKEPPQSMRSGYAAILCLYGLR